MVPKDAKAAASKKQFFKPGADYGIKSATTLNSEVEKYHKFETQNLYDFDGDGSMDAAERKRQQDAHSRALKKHDAAVSKAFANDAAGGAGQYTTVGSSLAVTTSANVKSDYGLADVSLYDFDGDGQLDVGAEQEAARKAHKAAVKARIKAEQEALARQNAELKRRRDHMRYVADEGVKADETDYLNDDDEDKTFWLMRHQVADEIKKEHEREAAELANQNRVYRTRPQSRSHARARGTPRAQPRTPRSHPRRSSSSSGARPTRTTHVAVAAPRRRVLLSWLQACVSRAPSTSSTAGRARRRGGPSPHGRRTSGRPRA